MPNYDRTTSYLDLHVIGFHPRDEVYILKASIIWDVCIIFTCKPLLKSVHIDMTL